MAQSVVTTVAAAAFEAYGAGIQIELVVHHQDRRGRNAEIAGAGGHAFAAQVHVSLGFEQSGARRRPPKHRFEPRFLAQLDPPPFRQQVQQPESGIVAVPSIPDARIAEARDELNRMCSGHCFTGSGLTLPQVCGNERPDPNEVQSDVLFVFFRLVGRGLVTFFCRGFFALSQLDALQILSFCGFLFQILDHQLRHLH